MTDPTLRPGPATEAIFYQGGAIGDIISSFPVFQWEARRVGVEQATVFCERRFANLFDRISYAKADPLDIPYRLHGKALAAARRKAESVRTMQVCGTDVPNHRHLTDTYQRDAWKMIGMDSRWEQINLCIDRRDEMAEAALINEHLPVMRGRPMILVSLQGVSSPFSGASQLLSQIYRQLWPDFDVVDLSLIKADNFIDLLGFYDEAECLITTDTATLHLAQASSIPVIPIVNEQSWLGSAPRSNHLGRQYYDQWSGTSIIGMARWCEPKPMRLTHVFPLWYMGDDDIRRHMMAAASWDKMHGEGDWLGVPCDYLGTGAMDGIRNSAALGDPKPVPFIKDVIQWAFDRDPQANAVIFTNTDVGFVPGTTKKMERLLRTKSAFFAYRLDHDKVGPMTYHMNVRDGQWNGGVDCFGLNRGFWNTHKHQLGDGVIGRTNWDLLWRDQLKSLGAGELVGCMWHEKHDSYWSKNPDNPGNLHNTYLYNAWQRQNDRTRPFRLKCKTPN